MNTLRSIILLLALVTSTLAAPKPDAAKKPDDTVFREPFTLKLHVDEEHYFEKKVGRIPFVDKGDVYLFKGEEFGLTLDIQNNSIRSVRYQPNLKKAEVILTFTQEVQPDGTAMMMLQIHNHTKCILVMDALMVVLKREEPVTTTILPVQPGKFGWESWPHPIVQLVLRNIRIKK